jgi:branched-chain amino acid transport system permease protein
MSASRTLDRPAPQARLARAGIALRPLATAAACLIGLAAFALVVPAVCNAVWLKAFTAATISSIVALGAGLLYGRLGLVSLCQVGLLGLGGWVTLKLGHDTDIPFPLLLLTAGGVTGICGILVGLPALRLSGLYFALITLMAAAAAEVVFQATAFPDGGPGFLGVATDASQRADLRRPAVAATDPAFFRYTLVIAALAFAVALVLVRSRPGRAWATIRQSEPAAASVGIAVTRYKLGAFVFSSVITGIAGGLLAASVGSFDVSLVRGSASIVLFAVVLVGGAFSLAGAVVAGAFMDLLPQLFDDLGISADVVLIIFGVGVIQVVATQPRGIVGQLEPLIRRRRG